MIVRDPDLGWLEEATLNRVVSALTADGAVARFVGGCVRDNFLGLPVTDIDIAIDTEPDIVVDLLERARIKAVPTGIKHGTVTAVADHRPFEITSLRHDVETYGRHASVAFTDDWEADAARRDFTINALYRDPDGTLFDPVGGRTDLATGHVCFVGDARKRIEEDRLRVLRFFRFYAHYGAPPPDGAALEACRDASGRLDILSAERVQKEMIKLLQAHDPIPALHLMRDTGVLKTILPEAGGFGILEELIAIESPAGRSDALLRLAALLPMDPKAATAVAERLRFSNAMRARLVAAMAPLQEGPPEETVYRLGAGPAHDVALLAGARGAAGWHDVLEAAELQHPHEFPLTGADVVALGVPSGPVVGEHLKAVEQWWIAGGLTADKTQCLQQLQRRLRKGGH